MNSRDIRKTIEGDLDALEMFNFNQGWESCVEYIEQAADRLHNDGYRKRGEILRELAKELRGDE